MIVLVVCLCVCVCVYVCAPFCSFASVCLSATQQQTAAAILREVQRDLHKRKSNNPCGRMNAAQRARWAYSHRTPRSLRKRKRDWRKQNAQRKMARRLVQDQEKARVWSEMVQYMRCFF